VLLLLLLLHEAWTIPSSLTSPDPITLLQAHFLQTSQTLQPDSSQSDDLYWFTYWEITRGRFEAGVTRRGGRALTSANHVQILILKIDLTFSFSFFFSSAVVDLIPSKKCFCLLRFYESFDLVSSR
jgi:hypothetical protein